MATKKYLSAEGTQTLISQIKEYLRGKISQIISGSAGVTVNNSDPTKPIISLAVDPVMSNGFEVGPAGIRIATATSQTAGVMSAADKEKLDGIEAGATASVAIDIRPGTENGTISVNGVDVQITGLGSAAFRNSTEFQAAGTGMEYMVVEELPPEGESNVIYLIRNTGEEDNIFDEYIFAETRYELIGTTKTDLSDYYTKEQVDSKVFNDIDVVRQRVQALESDSETQFQETEDYIDAKDAQLRSDMDTYLAAKANVADMNLKANDYDLARVAKSGSYEDLKDTPDFDSIVELHLEPFYTKEEIEELFVPITDFEIKELWRS